MNKKKFSYVLFIVFLFSFFNVEVKAAKELSCTYFNDDNEYAVKIAQMAEEDSSGNNGYVFVQKKNEVVDNGIVDVAGNWGNPIGSYDVVKYLKGDSNYAEVYQYFENCPDAITWKNTAINKKKGIPKSFYAFDDRNHPVYEQHKSEKKLIGNDDKYIAMVLQDTSYQYIDTTVNEIEAQVNKQNNKKCNNISIEDKWIKNNNSYASCLYSHDLPDNKGCAILQIDINSSGGLTPIMEFPKSYNLKEKDFIGTIGNKFGASFIKEEKDGKCPAKVYFSYLEDSAKVTKNRRLDYIIDFSISDKNRTYQALSFEAAKGKNLNDSSKKMTAFESEGYILKFIFDKEITCEDLMGEDGELADMLNMLVKLIKIAIPIMLIGLGSLDFVKATFSGEESNMKKAQTKFIKRLIIGVAIFLVPTLLHLILEIASNIWPVIDSELCGIL